MWYICDWIWMSYINVSNVVYLWLDLDVLYKCIKCGISVIGFGCPIYICIKWEVSGICLWLIVNVRMCKFEHCARLELWVYNRWTNWIVENGDIKAKSKILTTLTNSDKLTNFGCLEHEYIVYCASLKLCVYGKTFEMWNMEI